MHYLESQIHPLSSWMNKVLSSLNQSDPVHGDIATVHELIDAHEVSLLSYTENIQVEMRERRRENIGRRGGWGKRQCQYMVTDYVGIPERVRCTPEERGHYTASSG